MTHFHTLRSLNLNYRKQDRLGKMLMWETYHTKTNSQFCIYRHPFHILTCHNRKSTNNINDGSAPFKCPIKPWQRDCEPVWTIPAHWNQSSYITNLPGFLSVCLSAWLHWKHICYFTTNSGETQTWKSQYGLLVVFWFHIWFLNLYYFFN